MEPAELNFDAEDEDHVPYKDRPEWKDVRPIPQNDGPAPVVKIEYSERFQDVYDYFRGVMKIKEKSPRVLDLTADAIFLNAANYTVWQYRREVLQALNVPKQITKDGIELLLEKELEFSAQMIQDNQKNYQVWHHRKILISWAAGMVVETDEEVLEIDPEGREFLVNQELQLTQHMLSKDAKNYHAWQHRQWILLIFRAFENELDFVDGLIQEDLRNNSAWNQRYFVITNLKEGDVDPDLIISEIEYTWKQILNSPSNESPWTYLAGLLRLKKEERLSILQKAIDLKNSGTKSVSMFGFMLDILERKIDDEKSPEDLKVAVEMCDMLALSMDTMRSLYWNHIKDRLNLAMCDKMES